MRPAVTAWLAGQGLAVREEVWIAGRFADLVGFDRERIVAVELKLDDWHEALVQAMAYQLGANATYVALPYAKALRVLPQKRGFQQRLVGLLAIHADRVHCLVEPGESERFLPFVGDGVRRFCRGVRRRRRLPPAMKVHPSLDP